MTERLEREQREREELEQVRQELSVEEQAEADRKKERVRHLAPSLA